MTKSTSLGIALLQSTYAGMTDAELARHTDSIVDTGRLDHVLSTRPSGGRGMGGLTERIAATQSELHKEEEEDAERFDFMS